MGLMADMRRDVAAVFERDPAARSKLEVAMLYSGLHAVWAHRAAHALWRRDHLLSARAVSQTARALTGVEIHPGATLGRGLFIDHGMGVVIGETAEVGDGCTIYQGVTLGGTSLYRGTKRHPTLAAGVVVGAGAKVLGGFTVGEGARVGSNAVVVKEVPAGATVVGIPGRIVEDQGARSERFNAYAVVLEHDDPYAKAIQQLVEHSQELERTVAALQEKLSRLEKSEREQLRAVK
jgi:serine O-acetyltransferase